MWKGGDGYLRGGSHSFTVHSMHEDVVGGPREKASKGIPQSILCDNSRALNTMALLKDEQSVSLEAVQDGSF